MSDTIITAIITAVPTLIVAIATVIANNSLIRYRIDELTAKVEKHNQVIERMALAERDIKSAFEEIAEVKNEVKELRK